MEQELLIQEALRYGRRFVRYGKPASYIQELAKKDPLPPGRGAVCDLQGNITAVGDCGERFTMQSIAKLLGLILAIEQNGQDYVFTKVGYEPTGDSFQLAGPAGQLTKNKPYNPLINAGAIAVTSCFRGVTWKSERTSSAGLYPQDFRQRAPGDRLTRSICSEKLPPATKTGPSST
jgi:glutaminase